VQASIAELQAFRRTRLSGLIAGINRDMTKRLL
jgi:hypothetical protein